MSIASKSGIACGWSGGQAPLGHSSNVNRVSFATDPKIHGACGSKMATDSLPKRHELFLLDDGEQKVEFEPETRESIHELKHLASR